MFLITAINVSIKLHYLHIVKWDYCIYFLQVISNFFWIQVSRVSNPPKPVFVEGRKAVHIHAETP